MAKEFNIHDFIAGTEDREEEDIVTSPVKTPPAGEFDIHDFIATKGLPEEKEVVNTPEEFIPPVQKKFERPEDAEAQEDLTYQELAGDEDYMNMLREYQKSRFGEDSAQGDDETNEEYLNRFVTQVREFEWNSIDLGRQLDWVRNADEQERIKFGYLYSQLDKLPSFFQEGGGSAAVAVRDIGKSLLTDPLNYIGFGAGKVAGFVGTRAITQALKQGGKKLALEEAAKLSAKRMLGTPAGKVAAGGVAVESGLAAVEDLKQQELNILSQKYGENTPSDKSLTSAAITGVLGAGLGAAGLRLSGGLQGDKLLKKAREARVKQYEIQRGLRSREASIRESAEADAVQRSKEATLSASGIYDTKAGREVLDQLGGFDESGLTEPQFRVELMQRVGRVVTNVVEELAQSGRLGEMVDVDTKASEVIGKIVADSLKSVKGASAAQIKEQTEKMLVGKNGAPGALDQLGDIDPNILEGAISRAGLSTKQFVDAMGASYTDAGKYLQTASRVGKIMQSLRRTDPELEKALKEYTEAEKTGSILGKAHEGMKRLDRERRALMVTQVATTVRNVASAGARLSMEVPAAMIESSLYQIGKNFDAAMSGTLTKDMFAASMRDVVRDSFGSLDRMINIGATSDMADALLSHNSQLASRINRSLQEVGDDEALSKPVRMLNGLNMAQDQFFRKSIFLDTIDKEMRRANIIVKNPTQLGQYKSIEEFVASGKTLPTKVLEQAVEDSLSFTFARMPKAGGSKTGDTVGHYFIKMNEALGPVPGPLGTAAFPFSKFMVNALQFQFQYSPLSIASSAYHTVGAGALRRKALSEAAGEMGEKYSRQADAKFRKAREDFSKGMVGTAALYAAVQHRAGSQDTKWYEYKNEDGTTTDLRPFFPITPYLAVADLYVKVSEGKPIDGKEFMEGFTGAQFRTGASSALLENFFETLRGETPSGDRLAEMAGEHIGEVFGGGLTPLRVVRDIQAAYDTEAAMVRDARQTEGVSGFDRFTSALQNKIVKDLPETGILPSAKDLPEFQSPTREGPIFRQSPITGQITGLRREDKRSPAETELVRLGFKSFRIVPSSGDKTADALVKKYMGKEIEDRLGAIVSSESFQNKNDNQKRAAIANYLKRYRARAKSLAKIEAAKTKDKPYTPFDRAQFSKLTDTQRRLVEDYYELNHGMSVAEKQEMEPNINHLKKAIRLARVLARGQI